MSNSYVHLTTLVFLEILNAMEQKNVEVVLMNTIAQVPYREMLLAACDNGLYVQYCSYV